MRIRDVFGRSALQGGTSSHSRINAQLNPPIMDAPYGMWASSNSYGNWNNLANAIIRQDAMAVPTVSRCRNLICGTIATIPLQMFNKASGEEVQNYRWVNQPDPRQPLAVTLAWTVDSLFMYGVAYWQVTEVYKEDGRPAAFAWVQNDKVTAKANQFNTAVDYYSINGMRCPDNGIGSIVTLQALDQGLLLRSQSTIKAALDIEKAASIAAETPVASGYIKNNGADLPQDQVMGLLANWKSSRLSRGVGYLTQTLDFNSTSFSPKDMMYNEAKQYLATELARACNVPAYLVDAETFRGMTYQNIIDARKEFMAYSLNPFITAIESRLSMDDLTPRGLEVRFEVDETFLRVDPLVRLQVTEKLLELQLIDLNQAKEMEGLAPDGNDNETDI